jgi:ABC-type branched-subunit amino acid transport system substrate-binding protein
MLLSRRRLVLAAGLAAVLAGAAACSTKAVDTSPSAGASTKLATGPGVTDTTIKLGVLTDRTGPYAGLGKAVEQGRTLFWEVKNNQGGICGRKVELVLKDHGYNPQNAVTAYASIKDDVLALHELLGSPEIAALLDNIKSDEMLTGALSWSSSLLGNPYVVISGTTYDVEMINAVDFLVKNKGLVKGDKIGHIFHEGDYGENGNAGAVAAAKAYGLELLPYKIKPTTADLTAQVTALKAAGAKAVLLTIAPAQTASAVGVAAAGGYAVPFIGNAPSFSTALLATAAKPALEKQLYVATSIAPFSSSSNGASMVRTAFLAKYPDATKIQYALFGYAQAKIISGILETACKNNDLTRAGLLKAFQSQANVSTDGLIAPVDFSKPGAIPARQSYILRPDSTTPGGLSQVQDLFAAPLAQSYTPTH